MNDYGLFHAIERRFKQQDKLRLYSQAPIDVAFPYGILKIQDVVKDAFRPPQKLSVKFQLGVLSHYRGFKEIHQLMTGIIECLESPLKLASKKAVLRLENQHIKHHKDERTREGIMEYQAWLN